MPHGAQFMSVEEMRLLRYLLELPVGQYASLTTLAHAIRRNTPTVTKLLKRHKERVEYTTTMPSRFPRGGYRLKPQDITAVRELLAQVRIWHVPTLVLQELANQPLTAVQLADRVTANPTSLRKVIQRLAKEGKLVKGPAIPVSRGRSPKTYVITPVGLATISRDQG